MNKQADVGYLDFSLSLFPATFNLPIFVIIFPQKDDNLVVPEQVSEDFFFHLPDTKQMTKVFGQW